jgi:predicted TIM-barrel fold metal-dependent hydrolase
MRIDCHCHIFDNNCVPFAGFMGSRLGLAVSERLGNLLDDIKRGRFGRVLDDYSSDIYIDPFKVLSYLTDQQDKDNLLFMINNMWDFLRFLGIGALEIPQILDRLQDRSPGIDIWVPLMMDMTHGFPGSQPGQSFEKQRELMSSLTLESRGRIMPFYAFDPRPEHPDPIENLKKAIESQGFVGVKLYPPLGFKPFGNEEPRVEDTLMALYAFCCRDKRNPIPITAHTSWSGGAYSNELVQGEIDIKTYYRNMAHPSHWKKVLEKFPSLKLNLAHFGGLGEWDAMAKDGLPREKWVDPIVLLVREYDNVYTDLSYHGIPATNPDLAKEYRRILLEKIEGIEEKILLGSDWYMSRVQCGLRDYWNGFENLFRDEPDLFERMTDGNAVRFLRSEASVKFFPEFFSSQNSAIKDCYRDTFVSS